MKRHDEPIGKVMGIRIANGTSKPVKPHAESGRWREVWAQFQPLKVGRDKMLVVTLESMSDANRLNSAIHGYAEKRGCRLEGWHVRTQTFIRDDKLIDAWLWKEPVAAE